MSASRELESSVVDAEIAKFEAMAAQWWDPLGKFSTLHKVNPVRLAYIREQAVAHFGRDGEGGRPLEGLRLLDIGCGGGLLCEPMARLGADVVGADASAKNVRIAATHAATQDLDIDYRATTAEELAAAGETFDMILNMEVVEHVADMAGFVASCAAMVRPGGLMVVATLNRTLKSFALAIVGAEYILRWLPRGTHNWEQFITPKELEHALRAARLTVRDTAGVVYSPLADRWRRSADTDVNYMMTATRPS